MTNIDHYADARKFWVKQLAPANKMESRLAFLIARQDYLMWASMTCALELTSERVFAKHMRIQRDLTASFASLIQAVSTLQRQRLALAPIPPEPTKGKVLRFRTQSAAGRPNKIHLDSEPVPALEHFVRRYKLRNEPGSRPLLDLNVAA